MKPDSGTVTTNELHAYVDGRLNADRRPVVEAYLAEHPEEAARVRDYQAIDHGLHRLFDSVLDENVPPRLRGARSRRRVYFLARAAVIAACLVAGGVVGWIIRDQAVTQVSWTGTMVDQAMSAHAVYTPEVRHPVEVDVTEEKHLVAWLSKRLGARIQAPDLTKLGFELLGGRLLPNDGKPAAQFMYQDAGGHRLTLFVASDQGGHADTAFRFAQRDGVRAFYWIDRDMAYALIGDMDKGSLYRAAHQVYQQLGFWED